MHFARLCVAAALAASLAVDASAAILTRLPTDEKVVALTFDACEAGKVTHLDHGVSDYLIAHQIPFTVFMGGRFARDNEADAQMLAALPFVEIENHSWSHNNKMPRLLDWQVLKELVLAEGEIARVTGRVPRYFRFPAGVTDARTTALVEALGYRIVHWRWPEGDPDKHVTAKGMLRETLARVKPGDVLIFHINGNGVHTAEAVPLVVEELAAAGYRFVLLKDYLGAGASTPASVKP